jgi:Zn/Cd-binding protein ZinT
MLQRKEGKRGVKFVVKVNRGVTRALEYVQRIDRTPIQMTTNRKLALMMGRLAAEDAVKSIQNSRCSPELVPVQV